MGSAIFCLLLCAGGPIPIYAAGIPLYGRAFENTNGIGQPYTGVTSGNPPPFPTSTAHRSKFAPDVGSRHLPVQVAPTPGRAGVRRPRGRGELLVRPGQARARVVRRARHGADQGRVCACQGARGVYVLGGASSVGGARVCCCALRVAHRSSRFFLRVRGAAVVERQDGDRVAGVYGGGDARSAGPDAGASGTPVASRVGTAHLMRATRLLQNHLQ